MRTKKVLLAYGLFFTLVLFSGCAENSAEEKKTDASGGSGIGILDVNKKAQEDIAKATKQENDKINNSLKENNMNENSSSAPKAPAVNQELIKKYPFAMIKTSLGDIKVKFNGSASPLTVTNFLQLAEAKFYDGVKFHRVIKNFMIQGGDPFSKDEAMKNRWGTGGPGYSFKDELSGKETYPQGALAMANSGPNTNGSQFFIVTASPAASLTANYTVFGTVVSGMDIALKIENVQTIAGVDRPVENVVIKSVELLEK